MIDIVKNLIKKAKEPNIKIVSVAITVEQMKILGHIDTRDIYKLAEENNCKLEIVSESTMAPKLVVTYLGK